MSVEALFFYCLRRRLGCVLYSFIFFSGRQSSPDMAHLFVMLQDLFYLSIKLRVVSM